MSINVEELFAEAERKCADKIKKIQHEQDMKESHDICLNVVRTLMSRGSPYANKLEGGIVEKWYETGQSELVVPLNNGKMIVIQIQIVR